MTLSDYRKTYSWQGAMELAPGLINLAEALPASEEMGLNHQLRALMVELPAAIAGDLIHGSESRHTPSLKLVTAIELIDRVYPALDTAATRTAAEKLAERLTGTNWNEPIGGSSPAAVPVIEDKPAASAEPASAPATEPTPAPEPEPAEPEPTHVAVQPSAPDPESHVQPDSV
jgi:hypothetical protein